MTSPTTIATIAARNSKPKIAIIFLTTSSCFHWLYTGQPDKSVTFFRIICGQGTS